MPCFFFLGSNPCSTNPCRNGGVCKIRHYSYFCICPPKFGGDNCEKGEYRSWDANIHCEGRVGAGICSCDTWAAPLQRLLLELISGDCIWYRTARLFRFIRNSGFVCDMLGQEGSRVVTAAVANSGSGVWRKWWHSLLSWTAVAISHPPPRKGRELPLFIPSERSQMQELLAQTPPLEICRGEALFSL